MISNSFDICGITQNDQMVYHSALRHILTTEDLRVSVLDELDGTEDLNEMFVEDDDDEYVIESDDDDDDDDDESDVESMNSDATELLSDEPDISESNVEATEDEMDSETSYYCLNENFENGPTTSKSSNNALKRHYEQEDDGEEDEEAPAKLGDISNRMNLRSRSKRFKINENENATASKNSLKRRHDEDENRPKKAKK